jgi:hypothetical protein
MTQPSNVRHNSRRVDYNVLIRFFLLVLATESISLFEGVWAGTADHLYKPGEVVELWVNKVRTVLMRCFVLPCVASGRNGFVQISLTVRYFF